MCTVTLRNKDEIARCGFFVVPKHGPVLLGMPDIELLVILKLMSEVVGGQHADRKFNSQIVQLSNSPSCKAITDQDDQIR